MLTRLTLLGLHGAELQLLAITKCANGHGWWVGLIEWSTGRSAFTVTARPPGRQFIRSLVLFASVEPGTMPWPRQSLVVGGINQRQRTGLRINYCVSVASGFFLANILSNFLDLIVNCLIEDHFTEDNHELEEQH